MTITARFYVASVTQIGQPHYNQTSGQQAGEKVVLKAVYSADKANPNYSYSEATPQASVELLVTNKAAWGHFKPGHSYDAVFSATVPFEHEGPHRS